MPRYHDNRSAANTQYADLSFFRTTRGQNALRALAADEVGERLYIGTECECDHFPSFDARVDAMQYVAETYGLYCKATNDASLSNGFEVVSAPMTLAAHRAADWGTLLSTLDSRFGGRAHDTTTCGLHLHVSRAALGTDDKAKMLCIGKILELMERFQSEMSAIGRRDIAHTGWAKPTGFGHDLSDGSRAIIRKAQRIQSLQGLGCHDERRYHCVNLQNVNTVEFRFPKGTLKPDTYYATVAIIDGLVRFCKQKTTPEVHAVTFDELIQWVNDETLTTYWASRRSQTHRYTPHAA